MSSEPWLTVILAAPSGAGKTTLKNHLLKEFTGLRFSVSHTTRAPRPHERDHREYHFVSRDDFEARIRANEFAEFAEVFGNLYGTSRAELAPREDDRQRNYELPLDPAHTEALIERQTGLRGVVLDLDVQGARQLRAMQPDAVLVFILPPSMAELERRLRARSDEPESSVRRRLAAAQEEIGHYAIFDYLIVNDDLVQACGLLRSVVQAEWVKRWRQAPRAEALLKRRGVSATPKETSE